MYLSGVLNHFYLSIKDYRYRGLEYISAAAENPEKLAQLKNFIEDFEKNKLQKLQRELEILKASIIIPYMRENLQNHIALFNNTYKCNLLGEISEDPICTKHGNFFDRASLMAHLQYRATCPISGEELSLTDIYSDPTLTATYQNLKTGYLTMQEKLRDLNSDNYQTNYRFILSRIDFHAKAFDVAQRALQAIKVKYIYIDELKSRYKIDMANPDHLRYWQSQTSLGLFNTGGMKVTCPNTGEVFRVPTGIHAMMQLLTQHHESKEQLQAAMNRIRHRQCSFWNAPMAMVFRSANTDYVYHDYSDQARLR